MEQEVTTTMLKNSWIFGGNAEELLQQYRDLEMLVKRYVKDDLEKSPKNIDHRFVRIKDKLQELNHEWGSAIVRNKGELLDKKLEENKKLKIISKYGKNFDDLEA